MTPEPLASELDVKDLAARFDVHDPALADDPYRVFGALRNHLPVARSDEHGGFWIVTRYRDVYDICQRPDVFSSNPVAIPPNMGQLRPMIPLEIDPPDHVKYRQILAPLFGPAQIDPLEPEIRESVNRLVDRFIERGSCEFIADFAAQLPTLVFLQMMGWPLEDAPRFLQWTDTIIRGVPGEGVDETIDIAAREAAGLELYSYFAEVLDERSDESGDDFVSYLLAASWSGDRPLTQFEILDIVFLLLIAGLDTTKSALGNSFAYLAEHPEHRQQLVDDPGLIATAIEELLRWESLVATGRRVTCPVDVDGVRFQPEDRVMVLFGSAGRDEAEFPDADRVILDRHPNRHLAFGAGNHRCLGSHLARLELQVAFEVIHQRLPDYRIAPGGSVVRHLGHIRGVDRLPLVFTPGPRLDGDEEGRP